MKAMEASQHKEGGTVDAGIKRQAIKRISFVVLSGLQAQKNQRQAHRDTQPDIKLLSVVGEDRGVCNVNRRAG